MFDGLFVLFIHIKIILEFFYIVNMFDYFSLSAMNCTIKLILAKKSTSYCKLTRSLTYLGQCSVRVSIILLGQQFNQYLILLGLILIN